MYELNVKSHFDAAHLIRGHQGKCRRLHGHRWEVEAELTSLEINEMGMMVDFGEVKALLRKIIERYDHQNLLEVPPFDSINPTAENLAREIFMQIKIEIPSAITLRRVRIWESPDCFVSYTNWDFP